ncbi:hypothetical protein A2837_02895 [Candidatus Kaiserbacteria bacterium RIFCSPHIGHO2_01_FULL_46_22]|uniref:Uncharacterized protein n=1 Tax=Candidatus Kaiserbacteria bacterium RIFCSPHIGHO2_01_FULL_46_22 TaxID=1798475 RepID=A0A1F6BX78_9BACT|nr:MAG: hypothetical protein A2837_02895 [Candidatus Kaiserbacteria bacterium RIFCSPHIGHO2_01_FULL_46_22]
MVQNKEKYLKAKEFRQRGFTYSEISKIVGISKATVSNWFGKQSFSKKVRKDNELKARRDNVKRVSLVNKARNAERSSRYKEAIKSAETEFKHFKASPLFLTGLAIYIADGDLIHPTQIRLPNQRTSIHKIFKRFLNEFLGMERTEIYSKPHLTIVNEAVAKKKLLVWIDRLPRIVLNG